MGGLFQGAVPANSDMWPGPTQPCQIRNTDIAKGTGGVHWVAFAWKDSGLWFYNPLGRKWNVTAVKGSKLPKITKTIDLDREEVLDGVNCGQLSMAWLCLFLVDSKLAAQV